MSLLLACSSCTCCGHTGELNVWVPEENQMIWSCRGRLLLRVLGTESKHNRWHQEACHHYLYVCLCACRAATIHQQLISPFGTRRWTVVRTQSPLRGLFSISRYTDAVETSQLAGVCILCDVGFPETERIQSPLVTHTHTHTSGYPFLYALHSQITVHLAQMIKTDSLNHVTCQVQWYRQRCDVKHARMSASKYKAVTSLLLKLSKGWNLARASQPQD